MKFYIFSILCASLICAGSSFADPFPARETRVALAYCKLLLTTGASTEKNSENGIGTPVPGDMITIKWDKRSESRKNEFPENRLYLVLHSYNESVHGFSPTHYIDLVEIIPLQDGGYRFEDQPKIFRLYTFMDWSGSELASFKRVAILPALANP